MMETWQHRANFSRKYWAMLIAIVSGLLFPLASILIICVRDQVFFTIKNIFRIHMDHPELFLIYLLPVIGASIVHFIYSRQQKNLGYFQKTIGKKDETINRNAQFANEIGKGNYSVHIIPEGEQDVLGKSLLVMKENLLANYRKESIQNWISEGKNVISNILRIYNKLEELGDHILEHLVKYIDALQGAIYLYNEEDDSLVSLSTYAYHRKKYIDQKFKVGYGLIGQCAYEKDYIYRTEIPEDYFTISSGLLGEKKPASLLIVPLISDDTLQGVVEIASLSPEIPEQTIELVKELGDIIARTIFNLRVNQKTERLLQESQKMILELQSNEEKLKENASEIITIYDKDLTNTYVSPSVKRILGYSPAAYMQGKDFERLTLDDQERIKELFDMIVKDPSITPTIQYNYIRKDGQQVALESKFRNMLEDPSVNGIILNINDITEKYRAEKEERLRTRMQSLSENSLDMIIRLSLDGRFYYANPVVEDYLGTPPAELVNQNIKDIELPNGLAGYFDQVIISMKEHPKKTNIELTIPVHAGEKSIDRIMSMDAIPEYSDRELETILIVGHDISEAKSIEKEIQVKNQKIEDSINYAERIQSSILPGIRQIQEFFPKCFIYYKPRDVISGDFPWFFPDGDLVYLAAVDCTGHGVPGALLSFVGYILLNNIVDRQPGFTAGQICDKLHAGVRKTLKQESENADARDGMDIAFCKINLKSREIHYSGAHRPLYLLRNGELMEFKGDRKAIGGMPNRKKPESPFTNHIIPYLAGDKIFFYTDGMPDQLGGPETRKYSPGRIRNIIMDNQGFTMNQYKQYFAQDFADWMQDTKQIDDVLLIGIEF